MYWGVLIVVIAGLHFSVALSARDKRHGRYNGTVRDTPTRSSEPLSGHPPRDSPCRRINEPTHFWFNPDIDASSHINYIWKENSKFARKLFLLLLDFWRWIFAIIPYDDTWLWGNDDIQTASIACSLVTVLKVDWTAGVKLRSRDVLWILIVYTPPAFV